MMDKELETNFDLIVIGTGFTESLLAAAAARIGKKVLHLDRNNYYGGQWASFSLTSLQEWCESQASEGSSNSSADLAKNLLESGEVLQKLSTADHIYFNVKPTWHVRDEVLESAQSRGEDAAGVVPDNPEENAGGGAVEKEPMEEKKVKIWAKEELLKLNRKFNIDLAPKILFSRGALVELLISSNVARYVEFKCITRVLTWIENEKSDASEEGHLIVVPCSRSDVFTTDVVNLIEKRLLMKFLEFCHNYEQNEKEWKDHAEKPYKDYLSSRSLTPKLVHFIMSAIGMVDENTSCLEGLKKTSLFLNSLGRYGTMPFLFSLYGSGEMPQAFCRLCAVFEGVYILRRDVENIILSDDGKTVSGVTSEGQRFNCKNIVMDISYSPSLNTCKRKKSISRGVFITDRSVMSSDKENLTILRMPGLPGAAIPVTVIEVGSGTAVCPKNTYLVHLLCEGEDAENDLKTTVGRLFNVAEASDDEKPTILFSLYFNQATFDVQVVRENEPSNAFLCSGPDAALDYDEAINQAKSIFDGIFQGEEFLPRAPDPDEIVFDCDGEEPKSGDTFKGDDQDQSTNGNADDPAKVDEEKQVGLDDSEVEVSKEGS